MVDEKTEDVGRELLPAEFFMDLLDPPACVRDGVCDNCGRCEH